MVSTLQYGSNNHATCITARGMAIGKGPAQANAMGPTKINRSTSLCTNCMYSGDCLFQRQAPQPVQHCELHGTIIPAAVSSLNGASARSATVPSGLCATCDHRTYCTLRSSERIVLHCDHFE